MIFSMFSCHLTSSPFIHQVIFPKFLLFYLSRTHSFHTLTHLLPLLSLLFYLTCFPRALSCTNRATIIQHQTSRVGQPQVGSVALPAVLRAGQTPTSPVSAGTMQKAQYTHVSMQAHTGHVPPSVSPVPSPPK